MVVAKMEVDSWVSVQARREQFEQLYEDSPLVSPQKTPSFQPTPRPRTLSIPNKTPQNCDEVRAYQGKNTQLFYHEFNCKDSKSSPNNGPHCKAPDVVSSGQLPKNNILVKKTISSPSQRKDESSHNTVPPKSSPTKVIPVFRPTTVATDRTNVEVEKTVMPADASPGKRGRFFSHIRSRSHGNFIIKRDPSEERVSSAGQKNGSPPQKENRFHKEWLTPKRKQRSTDDLLGTNDSTSSSSFEGKQRLVSNVVKNMKNKETPVLRKLSFSSKNEKDFKNMKEKSVAPNKSNKQSVLLSSLSGKTGLANLSNRQRSHSKDSGTNVNHKPASEEKPTGLLSQSPGKTKVPEIIAKAVAEVASKRYLVQTRDTATPYSSDDRLADPPERPPRRRTPCPGQPPRRKGKAPSPPSQSSPVEVDHCSNNSDTPIKASPAEETPKTTWNRFRDSSSLDNLESPASAPPTHLVVRSCENLPDVVHTSSSSKSNIFYTNLKSTGRSPHENRHDSDNEREGQNREDQAHLKNVNSNQERNLHNMHETVIEKTSAEVEGLPGGPPPKKPPRTFAYDIYKNGNTPTPETKTEEKGKKENTPAKSTQPIYAVPVKKSKMMIPKPPVRSKSDLSKENTKPSVAPKPPHVLAKAKRTSLVDPLSNLEKEEEEAITSEFQRQAHVRYSLRRPEDPPPPHPSPGNEEGNAQDDSKSKLSVSSPENQHDMGYSTVHYNKENDNPTSERDINSTLSSTHGSPEHKNPRSPCFPDISPGEYEHVSPKALSSVAASCQDGRCTSEGEQPMSLTYCFANTPSPDVTYTHKQRSMSDETLYKGSKQGEPVYATPTFKIGNHNADKTNQKELHYMCSILFTDEEEADAGRDRGEGRLRRNSVHGREKVFGTEAEDGSKGRSSLISAWKREFRQSCRQVQSRIKKTVAR